MLESGPVKFNPSALVIGSEWSANIWSFLPGEAKPFQILEKRGDKFRFCAGEIEIVVP